MREARKMWRWALNWSPHTHWTSSVPLSYSCGQKTTGLLLGRRPCGDHQGSSIHQRVPMTSFLFYLYTFAYCWNIVRLPDLEWERLYWGAMEQSDSSYCVYVFPYNLFCRDSICNASECACVRGMDLRWQGASVRASEDWKGLEKFPGKKTLNNLAGTGADC